MPNTTNYPAIQTCLHCDKELYVEDDFDGYVVCPKCWKRKGYE